MTDTAFGDTIKTKNYESHDHIIFLQAITPDTMCGAIEV